MAASAHKILRTELRWGAVMGLRVAGILGLIIYATLAPHISPPSNVEFIDPKILQLSGEFTEQNLGTQVSGDGSVVVRIVATQCDTTIRKPNLFAAIERCRQFRHGRAPNQE